MIKALKLNTNWKRIAVIAVGMLYLAGAYFFAKWGFANAISVRAEDTGVAAYAVDLAPSDPQTHFAAAVLHDKTFATQDLQKALAEYETATILSRNNYLLWLELGKARERSGDVSGAEAALRKSLELAPNYSQVHWSLGNFLLRQGQAEEGFAQIRKAFTDNPIYTLPAVTTAWQIFDGDLGKVKNSVGESPAAAAGLVSVLSREKRFDEAFLFWKSLPVEKKKAEFKEAGEHFHNQLIDAKKHRFAIDVLSDIVDERAQTFAEGQIHNGGFEDALKTQNARVFDWRIGDGASPRIGQTDGQKRSGNYSLLINFNQPNGFRSVSQTVAVQPSTTYEISFHYRSDLKTQAKMKWEIADTISGKTLSASGAFLANTEWIAVSTKFAVPENSDGIIIRLVRENCAQPCPVAGSLWFDDFTLKPVN